MSTVSLTSASLHGERAYLLLRLALGVNILVHGLARMGGNYGRFLAWVSGLFAALPIPGFAIQAFAAAIPPFEALIGVLLILGLFTETALIAGGVLIILFITGMGLLQNWEIVGLQMIYVAFYGALLLLAPLNGLSLDAWRNRRNAG